MIWYAVEGDWVNSGLSGAAIIPVGGWFATAFKWWRNGKKVADAAAAAAKVATDIRPPLSISSKQFGTKWGRHASDYGLDPNSDSARAWFASRVQDVHRNPDEVRRGPWNPRGNGGDDYFFFRQGRDLLITREGGEFVTMFPNEGNAWFKHAEVIG